MLVAEKLYPDLNEKEQNDELDKLMGIDVNMSV